MASLIPNTDIVLCRDVPLDSGYVNTLTFATELARQNYFLNKAYKTVQQNSYQRVMKNRLRIECSIDDAMMCNYLYFRNNDFENKFIFAFITGWEYVNNVTTEITYEIDAFQTFWSDIKWLDVFIEREHALDDTIGANLVPENLEIGDYLINARTLIAPIYQEGVADATSCLVVLTTFNWDATLTNFTGDIYNLVYSGLNVYVINTLAALQHFMNTVIAANKIDGVIGAFMCPFTPATRDNVYWDFYVRKENRDLNGYTPKNNKLFTYPYTVLRVSTDTDSQEFKWENFRGADPDYVWFRLNGSIFPEPTLVLEPIEYELGGGNIAILNRMTVKNFPQVALDADVYKVYLAQNSASLPVSILSSAAQTAGNMLSRPLDIANVASAGINFASDIANKLAQLHDISTKPPQLNGTQSSCIDYTLGAKRFFADDMTIRAEFAQIIDEYFTMYGYATHRVKHPNVHGRRFWNYVKTKGITIDGTSIPSVYLERMNNAFNNGITFWHMENSQGLTDIVGRYSLNNVIGT